MEDFTFEIVSRKHGTFKVTAPVRFRSEIESHSWRVNFDKNRAPGRQCAAMTNIFFEGKPRTTLLHRFIWELSGNPRPPEIDHIDGNPLNNSESNLRAATHAENSRNKRKKKSNKSGYIGVKQTGKKWRADLKIGNLRLYIGTFDDPQEASRVRDSVAEFHHGEFAVLNGGGWNV